MRHNIKTEKLKSQYRYKNHAEKYFTSKNKKLKQECISNCLFYYFYTSNSLKV